MNPPLIRFSNFYWERLLNTDSGGKIFNHLLASMNRLTENIANGRFVQGYRKGVITTLVSPEGLEASYGPAEGCELTAKYVPRVEGEDPRLTVRGRHDGRKAGHCQVVLYHSNVLLEDETDPDEIEMLGLFDWNIVAMNCGAGEAPAPIHPDTLMHNHFHTSGGTNTGMSSEDFEKALRESFLYWKDTVFYE